MLCLELSERWIRQIVILGAGLDTFALRNPHGARKIRIYEVDDPATALRAAALVNSNAIDAGRSRFSDSGRSMLEKNV
jgi:O-methyltransferase involved in polyketide biosynthesis